MKILQVIVYLILLAGFVVGYMEGFDSNKKDAMECSDIDSTYSQYIEYMNWKEGKTSNVWSKIIKGDFSLDPPWKDRGVCCRYALVDNMIKEVCDD